MKAGRMDRRVTIQTRVLTRNAYGEEVESWTTLAEVWGEKVDLRGREFWSAQAVQSDVNTRFRLRYRSDVTVLHRLVCDGVTYDIEQVSEIGRRTGLEILATSVT